MPCIKRSITAATENALEGLKFSVQNGPSLVTLLASTPTAGETLSFSVNNEDIVVDAIVNPESASQVVDTDRDVILMQEAVPAGKFYLRVPSVTADFTYQINIEPLR